jgi:hypothetical protein
MQAGPHTTKSGLTAHVVRFDKMSRTWHGYVGLNKHAWDENGRTPWYAKAMLGNELDIEPENADDRQ